jgi:hypothetical protein
VTFAASVVWDPVVSVAGGAVDIATRIGAVVTMFAVEDADIALFVVDDAVMVTVPPGGTVEGPAYVTETPLAVCAFVDPPIVPQLDAPQLKDQSTPAAAGSPSTIAVNEVECAGPAVWT